MSNQQARQDDSKFTALLGHSSIADPSETRRVLATDGALHVSPIQTTNPTEGNNPSLSLSNTDEVVASTQIITKTISGTSYQATLSYNAAGKFLSKTIWSEV